MVRSVHPPCPRRGASQSKEDGATSSTVWVPWPGFGAHFVGTAGHVNENQIRSVDVRLLHIEWH